MKFKCEINMDNAVFDDLPEIELNVLIDNMQHEIMKGNKSGLIIDPNGNKTGKWEIK